MPERLNFDRLDNDFQFIEVGRKDPKKKLLRQRRYEFIEIHNLFKLQQTAGQAHRYLGCGNPYYEWKYPVHNFILSWLKLVPEGSILAATEPLYQTNILLEVCGRVCPQDRSYEGAHTLSDDSGAVTIDPVEKYITGMAFAMGWRPDLPRIKPTGRHIVVIDAGPVGLSHADVLMCDGVAPVVFDRNPEIGDLLTFGIPGLKLEKHVLSRRREVFISMGIEFHLNTEIDKDVTVEQLLDEYDAVFMEMGAYIYMKGGLPGEDLPGVHDTLDFLIANVNHNLGFGESAEDFVDMRSKRVVVLGSGDTVMDCNHTLIRQGTESVARAYRRDEENMPGSRKEVKNTKEEGVKFLFNRQSIAVAGEDRVEGVKAVETHSGEPDTRGRYSPEPIPGSGEVIPVGTILIVSGFRPSPTPWFKRSKIATDSQGRVVAPAQAQFRYQTSNLKIFAGGDMVRGSDLVMTAIFEGRTAAGGILDYPGV